MIYMPCDFKQCALDRKKSNGRLKQNHVEPGCSTTKNINSAVTCCLLPQKMARSRLSQRASYPPLSWWSHSKHVHYHIVFGQHTWNDRHLTEGAHTHKVAWLVCVLGRVVTYCESLPPLKPHYPWIMGPTWSP